MSDQPLQNYPLDAHVHCTDGRLGRSTHIVLNPITNLVTHIVVRQRDPYFERLVPVSLINITTPELILLNATKAEVIDLDPFYQTDFMLADVPHYTSDPQVTLHWPFVAPAKRIISETYSTVSPKELAVRRGARVQATDGRIGQVSEFLVDPETGGITHLILREGLIWDRKYSTVPIDDIDRIEEGVVYLKIDKQTARALPDVPLQQD